MGKDVYRWCQKKDGTWEKLIVDKDDCNQIEKIWRLLKLFGIEAAVPDKQDLMNAVRWNHRMGNKVKARRPKLK